MYLESRPYSLSINGMPMDFSSPRLMGIVNLTPDSFYGDSRCAAPGQALERVGFQLEQGADIIDLGACSTRPGAEALSAEEEWKRLEPALSLIRSRYPDIPLSVDTFQPEVARRAARDYAISIINDVSGGCPEMDEIVGEYRLPYVLTASKPMTSVEDLIRWFSVRMDRLREKNVADILVDPGFGFGKTLEDNYDLLARLSDFQALQAPILVGVSRKSMIYKLLDISPAEALNGTTAVHMLALQGGASVLRVHDVAEAAQCLKIHQTYNKRRIQ